jgi:hypothetical protein
MLVNQFDGFVAIENTLEGDLMQLKLALAVDKHDKLYTLLKLQIRNFEHFGLS